MDLRTYLHSLRRSWWIVLLFVVVITGASAAYTATITKKYSSTVTFYVSTPTLTTGNPLQADQFVQRRLESYVGLLKSDRLAQVVLTDTKLNLTQKQIINKISASANANTVLLRATVTDTSSARAVKIASSISSEIGGVVKQLDNFGTKKSPVVLEVISGPTSSNNAISPRPGLNIGLGFIIGLFLGLLAAALREVLNTSIQTVEAVRSLSGGPVLGVVGEDRKAAKSPFLVGELVHSAQAESFRQLRTNVQFIHADNPVKVIVVTSGSDGEGKTSVAANLAIVYAEAGLRTVLVEADLRNPRLNAQLGLSRGVGLSNALAGQVGLDDILQPWANTGVSVLAGGPVPPNPAELLGNKEMATLIEQLRGRFDIVIIDTPSILPITDAAVLATFADGVITVVRRGKTTPAQLTAVVNTLDGVDARILGSVITHQRNVQVKTKRSAPRPPQTNEDWTSRSPEGTTSGAR
ncbi:MAG: capsular exopolysaccharide family [Pseudonocardiales bacterium]|nr:capsular exopolysaccharide family [Pseudonocardiales bacterium]